VNAHAHIAERVLPHFLDRGDATIEPLGSGLINQTFLVQANDERLVLQRMADIFAPTINENIAVVTQALSMAGMTTPRLVPTLDGRLWLNLGARDGVWRLQTYVPGKTFDKVQTAAQAGAASELIARFHHAVEDLRHTFVGLREGVHDTAAHLRRLRESLACHTGHRLMAEVGHLSARIFRVADRLEPLPALPARICHGDLKLNNILFEGPAPPASEHAVCLIDLDTVGPMSLAYEMGDAWRSWCNRSGEDASQAHVDLEVMRASFEGYAGSIGRALSDLEKRGLLAGVEWISLELASRFAADALNESYFGWNPNRYPSRGDHNLVRARGQLALHDAFVATRQERAAILGL
jgi:Ser/Thr protein kinase RdoA (MazF antagonist)